MKRIMICSLNDAMGGAEQVLKMIAMYYSGQGYCIDVFFLTKSRGNLWQNIPDNINLYYTGAVKESKGFFQLYKNIKKRECEYEYCYTSHIYMNSFIGILRGLKLIRIKHFIGRDSRSYFLVERGLKRIISNFLINIGYRNLDLLISQTKEMESQFVRNKKKLSEKIKIKTIPNPVNINTFEQIGQSNRIIESEEKIIISAGRLIKIKGFDILIEAFHKLNFNNYKLIILGDGEERKNLERLIQSLNLQGRIELIGFVDNVYPYFKQAKMCIVSSIREGFPNVLLQMMSQNTKVVSTLCAGGIEDIQGVFTCRPNNAAALSIQMETCLNTDTNGNRALFDKELSNRSIDTFIEKIDFYLNES